jgi:RND family efflux transporter MFP subunit
MLLIACDAAEGANNKAAAEKRLPLVRVAQLDWQTVRNAIETTGFLESKHRVTLLSKISGRVMNVEVDEGQRVQKDQVLAMLDDREAQQAILQVEVQLEEKNFRKELADLAVDTATRMVEQAKIEREKALAEYKRNTTINPELIAPKELDDSKFAWESSVEALKVAEFDKRKAELEVKVAENAISELTARLAEERLKLAEHTIRSPIDGVIEDRQITGGETISTSTELFYIVDSENLVAYLRRPQREMQMVEKAKEVTFTTDAAPDRTFTANIDVFSPVVDQASGSFRIRIRVRKEDTKILRPGMFIKSEILTEDERRALMVPKAAVINELEKSIVYAVRDNIAHRLVLDPGLEMRTFVECKNLGDEGLAAGDLVVISGQQDLRDKAEVEVVKD